MQAFVFTDKRLERYAGQFVWLQVDIENSKNATFLQKYPIPAIPTLMVIDPRKESVALRYNDRCTKFALENYPKLRGTSSGASIAAGGLGCAAETGDKSAIDTLETATRESMSDPKIPLAGDDISGMYQSLIAAREAVKDEAGQRKVTEEWSAFLDAEAAKAKTPEERTVYDSHRLTAYMVLGHPEKAIPMLEQSEKDFPNDYNPPA